MPHRKSPEARACHANAGIATNTRAIAGKSASGYFRKVMFGMSWDLVGAPRFELGTPSPPDWCANRAALRSAKSVGAKLYAGEAARARASRRPDIGAMTSS